MGIASSGFSVGGANNPFRLAYPAWWTTRSQGTPDDLSGPECTSCHTSLTPTVDTSARNAYGLEVGLTTGSRFYAPSTIENFDPDGDQVSTIEEIQRFRNPGSNEGISLPTPGAASGVSGNSVARGTSSTFSFTPAITIGATPTFDPSTTCSTCTIDLVSIINLPAGVTLSSPTFVPGGSVSLNAAANAAPGNYTLNYSVKVAGYFCTSTASDCSASGNRNSSSAAGTVSITVTAPVNTAPVGVADSYSTNEDTALTVSTAGPLGNGVLSNDTDAENNPLTAVLQTGPSNGSLTLNPDGSFTYTPNANFNGSDSFVYKASDGALQSANTTVSLTINAVNDPPTANADGPLNTAFNTALVVAESTLLANDTDVENQTLSVTSVQGAVNGSVARSGGNVTFTPTNNFSGSASFTYSISDGNGGAATGTVSVTVGAQINTAPVGVVDSYSTNEDTALTVSTAGPLGNGVLSNDTDAENNPLTAVLQTGPSNGSLTLNPDGSFTYTPNANFNGSDSFVYKASDGALQSANTTVSLTINAVNDPPTANADGPLNTAFNTALVVAESTLLANDTDVENQTLSVTSVQGAVNGSVARSGGNVTFTPTNNFSGSASFTYSISDGNGGAATGTVSVTVGAQINTAPVANPDSGQGFTTNKNTSISTASVLTNDTDADGDPLTISGFSTTGTTGQVSGGTNGSFTYNPNGRFANLNSGQTATDQFSYTITDGRGGSSTAVVTITINGINTAPVATPDVASTTFNTPVTIAVASNDTGGGAVTAIQVSSSPANGSAAVNGLSVIYTPQTGFAGTDTFQYIPSNGPVPGLAATVTVTVRAQSAFTPGTIRGATANAALVTTAQALDETCTSIMGIAQSTQSIEQRKLFTACQALSVAVRSGSSIDAPLSAIRNEEAFAASDASFDIARNLDTQFRSRLDTLAAGKRGRGVDLSQLQLSTGAAWMQPIQSGLREAAELGLNKLMGLVSGDKTKWGFFTAGQIQFGSRSAKSAAGARHVNNVGITAGIDYAWNDSFITGIGVTYVSQSSNFTSADSGVSVNGLSYTAYSSLAVGAGRLEGSLTWSDHRYKSRRNIAFSVPGLVVDEIASARFGGQDIIASGRARIPLVIESWDIELAGSGTYISSSIDAYMEEGASAYNLSVGKQTESYLMGELGARIGRQFKTGSGSITPSFDLNYTLLSGRGSRSLVGGFVADPLNRQSILLVAREDADSGYFDLGIGAIAAVGKSEVGLRYRRVIGLKNASISQIGLSLGMPF